MPDVKPPSQLEPFEKLEGAERPDVPVLGQPRRPPDRLGSASAVETRRAATPLLVPLPPRRVLRRAGSRRGSRADPDRHAVVARGVPRARRGDQSVDGAESRSRRALPPRAAVLRVAARRSARRRRDRRADRIPQPCVGRVRARRRIGRRAAAVPAAARERAWIAVPRKSPAVVESPPKRARGRGTGR